MNILSIFNQPKRGSNKVNIRMRRNKFRIFQKIEIILCQLNTSSSLNERSNISFKQSMTSTEITDYAKNYIGFLNTSLTPHHFIDTAIEVSAGMEFMKHPNTRKPLKPGKHYIVNGTMLYLIIVPEKVTKCVSIAVHIDSPVYKLNQNFTSSDSNKNESKPGLVPLSISSYGGMLLHPWFDRELMIAGKVVNESGEHKLVTESDLICLIPSLPPHLNNGTYSPKEFKLPEKTAFTDQSNAKRLEKLMENTIVHDLSLLPVQSAYFDGNTGFVFSGRQDNLSSCYAALNAIFEEQTEGETLKIVGFYDYEEIGSLDRSGAESSSISQIIDQFEIEPENSIFISADAAHAFNPMYPSNYESNHRLNLGCGVGIKHAPTYSTEINSASTIIQLCRKHNIKHEHFCKSNCVRGGSTVGSMLSAQVNLPTIDIGVPLLAMHSCREVTCINDIMALQDLFTAAFRD